MIKKKTKRIVKAYEKLIAVVTGKKIKRNKLTFEIHISDDCNLNCKGCYHFAPLAKKGSIYNIDQFEKDLRRIYSVFGKDIEWVHLLGGEPLLNVNVNSYIEIARDCLPEIQITLITNGILLMKMPDSFFEVCKKNDVLIDLTIYPIDLNYERIQKYVAEKGCKLRVFGDKSGDKGMRNTSLNKTSKTSAKKNFLRCRTAGICNSIKDGKIYYCSIPAYICIFNKYFNENFDNSEDGIDIHNHTATEILDFLRSPHNFCKYCDLKYKRENKVRWDFSFRKISEWTVEEQSD